MVELDFAASRGQLAFGHRRDVVVARTPSVQCRRIERVDSSPAICLVVTDGLCLLVADSHSVEQTENRSARRYDLSVHRVPRLHRFGNHHYVRARGSVFHLSSPSGPAGHFTAHSKSMGTDARKRPATRRSAHVGARVPDLLLWNLGIVCPLAWRRRQRSHYS